MKLEPTGISFTEIVSLDTIDLLQDKVDYYGTLIASVFPLLEVLRRQGYGVSNIDKLSAVYRQYRYPSSK